MLITLPIPTIAAVNGHAMAAGFLLALACDYRVGRTGSKGWFAFNEVDFGAPLPPSFAALVRAKISCGRARRDIGQYGKRYTATDLDALGLIDALVEPGQETEAGLSLGRAVAPKARMAAWGMNRVCRQSVLSSESDGADEGQMALLSPVLDVIKVDSRIVLPKEAQRQFEEAHDLKPKL